MNNEHAQKIVEWRKSLTIMNDNQFFELIRMYLGEVKSPFNKQNLIEDLSSFLRKIENKQKIVNLLSESDQKVIAAVKFIKNATQKKLTDFFKDTFTFSKLYERVINLEERLILYKNEIDGKTYICINPHLDEIFEKIITKSVLIKEAVLFRENTKPNFKITSELLASFICFVKENGDLCKANGTFKKRALSEIEVRFPELSNILFIIKNAFENLLIIKNNEDGKLFIDDEKLLSFAKLPQTIQLAYICVASQGRFSRTSLVQQAKLLIDTILSIPKTGYTKENLLRSAYINSGRKKENNGEKSFGSKGRFAAILERAKQKENEISVTKEKDSIQNEENIFSILDRLLENAIEIGLLKIKGIEENGDDIFEADENLLNDMDFYNSNEEKKVLSIDAAYNVMLFQGLTLQDLVQFTNFVELKKFDTAVSFEITKKSIMRGFDSNLDDKKIFEILKKYCFHELPQNLMISIEDWKKTYSSTTIFKGYVVKVSGENNSLSQKNPNFASHIIEVLAPGIFLLDAKNDDEAKKLLKENGTDFIGKIKTSEEKSEIADFPIFYADFDSKYLSEEKNSIEDKTLTSDEERKKHFDYLRNKLKEMELTREEYECLLFRINRKIILDENQLKKESVKFAKLEASGMDFSGKVHIIEQAVIDKSNIEITFLSPENSNGNLVIGLPISTEKSDDDVTVTMKINGTNVLQIVSISQASKVRRIYGTAFS